MYLRKDSQPVLVTPGFEHPSNIVLFDDGRDVYVKRIENDESLTTNLVQYTKMPLSRNNTYYTTTILEITQDEFIMIGLTNRCVPSNPMWTIDRSVRYHSNDGGVFNGGLGIRSYHTYDIGDKITCRLDYTGPDCCLINFLKNDTLVYRQWANLPPGQLYPTVGVSRTEAQLRVEWPTTGAGDINIQTDLPSNWFGWTGLKRDDQEMVVTLEEPDGELEREAYNVQCPTVLGKDFSYFEIEVLNKAPGGSHVIGLVAGNCEPFVMPGMRSSSIGYQSDDGKLYADGQAAKDESNEAPVCQVGDKMGCGIVFPDIDPTSFREPILVLVFFTKNGQLVYKRRMRQPRGGFFPSVGFLKKEDSIKLNVKCTPPSGFRKDLVAALNSPEVSNDFRCSEVFIFKELAADSALMEMSLKDDNPQLIQCTRYPMSEVGDGFSIQVQHLQASTEIQLGVSIDTHSMEGDFLGSNKSSSGYLLKLGSLTMKEGMRTVSKWQGKKEVISCYLDFIDDQIAVVCFEKQNGEMLGRTTVSREAVTSPLFASVVLSAGPCSLKIDWSRSIYTTHYLDRSWGTADTWILGSGIKGVKNTLTLQAKDSYSFAACAQCRQPMLTGTSYFGIKLLGGQSLPGIGLSKCTTDTNNMLGSEFGEVCFLPSKGELIIGNYKWRLKEPREFKKGDSLHCGFVFTEADRVMQKGVVYFCHNNEAFFHCKFTMAHGGVYPSIVLSSKDSSAEVLQASRAQPLPESLTSEWLNENGMDGVEPCPVTEHSNNYHRKVSAGPQEIQLVSSDNEERIVYVSHTIRESERVEPIINQLRRDYLNFVFETSTNCVELTEKQDAIDKCEFVLMLMSQIYSESHEMAMEYSLFANVEKGKKVKPILVAAERAMAWPPGHFFQNEKRMEQYPLVQVASVDDKEGMKDLTKMLDKEMRTQAERRKSSNKIKNIGPPDTHSLGSDYGHEHTMRATHYDDKAVLKSKSSTCSIL